MIIDDTQTIVVVPDAKAVLTSRHLVIVLLFVGEVRILCSSTTNSAKCTSYI
jgi:hypothetical protein